MPNLHPKRFSNPETLRKIRRDLLLAWLSPSEAYLEQRGLFLPPPDSEQSDMQITAIEERLNTFFAAWKRDRGARVFAYQQENEWWFLVRHGGPCRREPALEDGLAIKSELA